jgi:glycosyltransferase involved in cell wall biosynthesis
MIVRDAAPFIEETLTCALPYIDSWSIVDTGSVDDTPAVIERFFTERGVPGTLHHRPWVGFAPNRTEAIELSIGTADYAFMIDADDLVEGPLNLDSLTADAYQVRFGPDNVFWRPAFFRLDRRWEYRGVVHEYAVCLD